MSTHAPRQIFLPIIDQSRVGEARRAAAALAAALSFDASTSGNLAIIVTEMATNLARHATQGSLLIQTDPARTIEVLALDKGPGMGDVTRCLEDGYSTAGSPGTGLGALIRLSNDFAIHSAPGIGTAVLCRIWPPSSPPPADQPMNVGGISLPKAGESVSGDAWAHHDGGRRSIFMLADGLGHGPYAAEAAEEAVRIFLQNKDLAPAPLLESLHEPLRKTRGASVATAEIDLDQREVRYAGIGNIAGAVLSADGTPRNMISHGGILGHTTGRVQQFSYPWPPGSLLVMNSDGLLSQWRLDRYHGLLQKHPTLIAGVLIRDFSRGRDDATALVARERVHGR